MILNWQESDNGALVAGPFRIARAQHPDMNNDTRVFELLFGGHVLRWNHEVRTLKQVAENYAVHVFNVVATGQSAYSESGALTDYQRQARQMIADRFALHMGDPFTIDELRKALDVLAGAVEGNTAMAKALASVGISPHLCPKGTQVQSWLEGELDKLRETIRRKPAPDPTAPGPTALADRKESQPESKSHSWFAKHGKREIQFERKAQDSLWPSAEWTGVPTTAHVMEDEWGYECVIGETGGWVYGDSGWEASGMFLRLAKARGWKPVLTNGDVVLKSLNDHLLGMRQTPPAPFVMPSAKPLDTQVGDWFRLANGNSGRITDRYWWAGTAAMPMMDWEERTPDGSKGISSLSCIGVGHLIGLLNSAGATAVVGWDAHKLEYARKETWRAISEKKDAQTGALCKLVKAAHRAKLSHDAFLTLRMAAHLNGTAPALTKEQVIEHRDANKELADALTELAATGYTV